MTRTKPYYGERKENPNKNVKYSQRIPNTSSNAVKRPVGAKLVGGWNTSHSKRVFNGGSSLDWMKFKPRMEAAFVENECYHYVQCESGISLTSTIIENKFTDAEPVEAEMIDHEIGKQLSRANASFDAMISKTSGMINSGEITPEVGRMELLKLDNARVIETLKIENSEHSLKDKFMAATKDWRNHKEQHVTFLGDSSRAIVKDLLV